MKEEHFSIKARVKSFEYAFTGIKEFFNSEHNGRIHLTATVVVLVLAIVLKVTHTEIILLLLVTGLVWICEILNTVVEKIMDFISSERLPKIKFIKDVAAGAVLIAAVVALITGCLIFIPKL